MLVFVEVLTNGRVELFLAYLKKEGRILLASSFVLFVKIYDEKQNSVSKSD